MNQQDRSFFLEVAPQFAGLRVDQALAKLLPEHSRSAVQQWLKQGLVQVNGRLVAQKLRLAGGETLQVSIPEPKASDCPAQRLELDIIAQDADLLVINKPPGLVVHPGAGHADRTLLNGLLYFDAALRTLPRAGIIHRLDKDTSGLLVVARNEIARQRLIEQLQDRSMQRGYLAVANGVMVAGERIAQPIARHRQNRVRMCVAAAGKPAVTQVRVERKFRAHCLLRAALETGRTHQIRVHLSWRGFPLVGDKLYAGRVRIPPAAGAELTAALQQFPRQALHAAHLSLRHPRDGKEKQWQQPMPADLARLVAQLECDADAHAVSAAI